MNSSDYTKAFFMQAWGPAGYQEEFSYGVGIEAVCAMALYPFCDSSKAALEIGPGGGTFTRRMAGQFRSLTAIDVIPQPDQLKEIPLLTFIELPDRHYGCYQVETDSIDFIFSYNVFCHLSNEALTAYVQDVSRVARDGANFVFMLSRYEGVKQYFPDQDGRFKPGDLLPNGHFYQDMVTLLEIDAPREWILMNSDMIPEHRDLIIHLKRRPRT